MFPDITRDEVFRIETPHLWLRWPTYADAYALAAVLAQSHPKYAAHVDDLRDCIRHWRQAMEAGHALHLVLAPKGGASPVGIVQAEPGAAIRCRLLPGDAVRSLGVEAVAAFGTMIRWVGTVPAPRERAMAQQRGLFLRAEFAEWCAAPA